LFNPRAKFWNYFPRFGIYFVTKAGHSGQKVFVVGGLKIVGEYDFS
jgi:hypothetical protein